MAPALKFASPPSRVTRGILPTNPERMGDVGTDTSLDGVAYQVDYTCVNAGKTIGATKRRIRWRFGFANQDAIEKGILGPDCRGEEHEVIFNWSLKSGKQVVLADGNEIFVECRPYETTFEYSWRMRGNHQLKIRGSVKPSFGQGQRQFDLWIDGKSFFQFHQIFELGRKPSDPPSYYNTPSYTSESDAYDNSASYRATRSKNRTQMSVEVPVPESEQVEWPKTTFHNSTPSTVATNHSEHFDYQSVTTNLIQPNDYLSTPPPTMDQVLESQINYQPNAVEHRPAFSVAPAYDAQHEKQYRHNVMSYQVMQAYGNTPPVVPPTYSNQALAPAPETNNLNEEKKEDIQEEEEPTFEGEQEYIAPRLTLEEDSPSPDNVSNMLKKLCNLDDITSSPFQDTKLTLEPLVKHKKGIANPKKSTPIAPATMNYFGPQPSLNEMKAVTANKNAPPSREVMKQQPGYATAGAPNGALVVYGQSQGSPNEAPPLQRPVGFGVGAQMNQGYGNYTLQGHGVYANN